MLIIPSSFQWKILILLYACVWVFRIHFWPVHSYRAKCVSSWGKAINADPSQANVCILISFRLGRIRVPVAASATVPCTSASYRFPIPQHFVSPQFPGYQWWPKVNGDPQAQILSLAHSHCHSHSQSQSHSQSGCLSAAGSGALQICQYCECSGLNRVINCAKWIWIILHWEANKITQQNNEKKKKENRQRAGGWAGYPTHCSVYTLDKRRCCLVVMSFKIRLSPFANIYSNLIDFSNWLRTRRSPCSVNPVQKSLTAHRYAHIGFARLFIYSFIFGFTYYSWR